MVSVTHPRAWLERRRARRQADYWVAHGFESRYPWRVAELTGERERKQLARALGNVLGELAGRTLPGAAPLRRTALRPHVALLERIQARLLDAEPVTGIGMLSVQTLLTSPDSCLYASVDDVEAELRRVLVKLEAH
ncbi:MAG TPA: hypothetical protein VFA82_06665 [Gaiellaceae bacterium]|nr:hypothetical protein [Gaiellaceae bacterium]